MSRINNKLIIFGLILLAIFSVNSVAEASQYRGIFDIQNRSKNSTKTNDSSQSTSDTATLIDTIEPNYIKAGSHGVIVSVIGSNFTPSSIVRFDNSDIATTFIDSNQLSARLKDVDITNFGEYSIDVFTPDASGSGISNTIMFTVNNGTPVARIEINTNPVAETVNPVTENTSPTVTNNITSNTSTKNLTANVVSSSLGFFPWGFLFWVLLSIVILLSVIVWRQFYLKKKEKYEEEEEMSFNHA